MVKASLHVALAALVAGMVLGNSARADLQQAVAAAQKSGRPLFVIGSTDTCPHCVRLKERLSTEPELQQLMAQYVPLEIKVGTTDWQSWSKLFKTGNGVPQIFVVTPTGEEVINQTGAPQGEGLNLLLRQGIEKTGGPKPLVPPADDRALASDAAKAKLLLARGQTAAAVEILAARAEAASNPTTPAAQQMVELIAQATAAAQARLAGIEEDAATPEAALDRSVLLVEVEKEYGKLPGMLELLADQKAKLPPETWGQAELLHAAGIAESSRRASQAMAVYRQIQEKYPGSLAAERAGERLAQMGRPSVAGKPEEPRPAERSTGESDVERLLKNQKTAASYLKLARSFVKTRPEKAREYANKVIDLVPGTAEAQQAESMLRELP